MQNKHRQIILHRFPIESKGKKVVVLEIPDDCIFMDPELIQMIRLSVDPYL